MKHFTRTRSEMLSSVVSVLAPLGWATFGRWHKDETTRIVRLHSQGAEASEIDSVVTELWNSTSIVLLKNIAAPLRRYGRTIDHEFQRQNFQRGNLIDEAIACHFNGHYGAATLLTYAQIDGLTRDITGSSFFSGSTDDTYMDDSTLAGFEGNLPVVREFFSEPINETGFYSKLSRHGAAHGRDLSFANRVTSTKALVLLGALTEYLEDRANTKAQKQARQNEIQARGLSGTDDTGRLLDDRHFDKLYFFAADLDTWVFNQACLSGSCHPELWINKAYELLEERNLHRSRFTWGGSTPTSYWWFYKTPSGHHLGRAAHRHNTGRPIDWRNWQWDAPVQPLASPLNSEGWQPFDGNHPTPNWDLKPFPTL